MRAADLAWQEVDWPATVEPTSVARLLLGWNGTLRGPLGLEVVGFPGAVKHRLGVRTVEAQTLKQQFGVALPAGRLVGVERQLLGLTRAWRLRLSSHRRPLATEQSEATSQAVLAVLTHIRPGEVLALQWLFGPRLRAVMVPNKFEDFTHENWWQSVLAAPLGAPGPVDPAFRQALKAKQGLPGWRVLGRVAVKATSRPREVQLLTQLVGALRAAEGPGMKLGASPIKPAAFESVALPWRWPNVLNVEEALAVAAWPLGTLGLPGIGRAGHRPLPPSRAVPSRGRIVADGSFPGQERPLALNHIDARQHLLALGPTGSGKSTMLLGLVEQDLRDGRGIIVIDPKGDLVDDILARVPDERLDDVVVLDPTDLDQPVALNPLAGPADPALKADFLLGIFHRLFAASWGPRTSDILHASLLTLASTPEATLVALPVLLQDAAFRRHLVGQLDDPLGVSSFWGWYEAQSEEGRAQAVAPVMNKLRAVLMRPGLRNVLGQSRPRFDLGSVFTDRKVLLVSLARGAMGSETASLFGSLVVGAIWQTALQRSRVPAERRSTVSWVIDEWQTVVQLDDLADVLATSRSLGLAVTLANQHLGQLPADLRSAALANARSKVCFRLSAEDATVMARGSTVLKAEDFQGLGAFETYSSLVAGGEVTSWASGMTRPPSAPLRAAAEVRRRSAVHYGTPRAEIEAELQALLGAGSRRAAASTIGRKRRDPLGGTQ